MKIICLLFCGILLSRFSAAQDSTVNFKIVNGDKEPVFGASVHVLGRDIGAISDMDGSVTFEALQEGVYVFEFRHLSYETSTMRLRLPYDKDLPVYIVMEEEGGNELDAIIVAATRGSRQIRNSPTRVEVIAGEELEEKAIMNSGNLSMLLRESTGIQVQQTSATLANATFRIQGLDGRYTQLLRDGLPLYSGYSGGLSIMQVPPLDLKQVEIIKGSASTLYGGGAIAGLINLVPIKPDEERKLDLMTNVTTAGGQDYNVFYAEKYNRIGVSVYGTYNHQNAYDPDDNNFTDIPEISRFNLNPSLFFYGREERSTLEIGAQISGEQRNGGDIRALAGQEGYTYVERNKTNKVTGLLQYKRQLANDNNLQVKANWNHYKRSIDLADYSFSGRQISSFAEVNYAAKTGEHLEWMSGINLWTDQFTDQRPTLDRKLDYEYVTIGAFVQNTWSPDEKMSLETGMRLDRHNEFGTFLLPRFSLMYRFDTRFTGRLGGGLGYQTPTVFTEKSEEILFRNLLPIDPALHSSERSQGINLDLNFRTAIGEEVGLDLNQLFFYTKIDDPLVLTRQSNGSFFYRNAFGDLHTAGFETNIKITYRDFKLFSGYTLIDARRHYDDRNRLNPLTPKHQLGMVLMYEIEGALRIGYEAYYTGSQVLEDERETPSYWRMGVMGEKSIGRFSLFVNFENFTDTRQSRFEQIVSGTPNNPVFPQIWAPTDGFVANMGVKFSL